MDYPTKLRQMAHRKAKDLGLDPVQLYQTPKSENLHKVSLVYRHIAEKFGVMGLDWISGQFNIAVSTFRQRLDVPKDYKPRLLSDSEKQYMLEQYGQKSSTEIAKDLKRSHWAVWNFLRDKK